MKYTLHDNLVLTIEPETPEEQALVNILEKMELKENGHGIINAGMDWDGGRRTFLGFKFVDRNKASVSAKDWPDGKPKICQVCGETCAPDDLKCDECGYDLQPNK